MLGSARLLFADFKAHDSASLGSKYSLPCSKVLLSYPVSLSFLAGLHRRRLHLM
jgi:hypothetical protein